MAMHRLNLILMVLAGLVSQIAVPAQAAQASADVPVWLQKHVGTGEGQIAAIVLQRARALYHQKLKKGTIANPCYLAMDATRPSTSTGGRAVARFYTICEANKHFRATSSGYGNGRKLPRANFSNGRQCAKNFSNAEGSKLTMGGAYVTAESRTSFKGYHRQSGQLQPFLRTFLLFDGEGDSDNARERAIGGHQAAFLKWQCRMKIPQSPHADEEGFVPYGKLVDYTSGRSNGCTTWSESASKEILRQVEGKPTTLYIYPEAGDIAAVAKAVKKRRSLSREKLYWNTECLNEIGSPKFWPKRKLQPIINAWRQSLPKYPPRELPICD